MDMEQTIRQMAADGCSKRQVAQTLGLHFKKLAAMCECMPDIVWKPSGQTLGDKEARASQKGFCTEAQRASIAKAWEARRKNREGRYTVQGVTAGTIRELCGLFGIEYATVRSRMSKGWTLERAVTTPLQPKKIPKNTPDHPWRRAQRQAVENSHG